MRDLEEEVQKFKEIINDSFSHSVDQKQKNALRLIVQLLNVICCLLMLSTATYRLLKNQIDY